MIDVTCYRLPLPIDPVNPARGLWGMVDWKKYNLRIMDGGEVILYPRMDNGGLWENSKSGFLDPETALLKALCEQEGV